MLLLLAVKPSCTVCMYPVQLNVAWFPAHLSCYAAVVYMETDGVHDRRQAAK
jgi:hypothetical protein